MREIPLTRGEVTLVDDQDFAALSQFKWYANWSPKTKSFYAVRSLRHGWDKERMHRRILGLEIGGEYQVDHINHDTLDNRRDNLRIVTCRQNHANRINQSKLGVGICRRPRMKSKPFQAWAWLKGFRHLGYFKTVEEAKIARMEFFKRNELI